MPKQLKSCVKIAFGVAMQLKDVEGGNLMKHGFVTDSEGPQAVHAHKLGAKESNHCSPTPQNAESPSVLNVFRYL